MAGDRSKCGIWKYFKFDEQARKSLKSQEQDDKNLAS